jgi:glyoxylase-like metal-dependent hydrolase (beta-lactamase superfamily II)
MAAMEEWPTGRMERLSPLVRRLLAPNPSPFTYSGTLSYVVGNGEVAVIDPGPDLADHVDALLSSLGGERVAAILCTHTHRDHSPASRALQLATGAPIVGCAPLTLDDEGPRADAAFDADYRPDRVLEDGEQLQGEGWSLEAVATPGHTSNHLCFGLPEEQALFSGDHVMGWSTTIVSPPDGDMAAYMASLARLQDREEGIYYPAHGPVIEKPLKLLRGLILHRKQREAQVLGALGREGRRIEDMVPGMYKGVDERLYPAAARSVLAHLIDLANRGLAEREGEAWRLAAAAREA